MFSPAAYAADKQVLLISAYHPGFPSFLDQVEGVKAILDPAGIHLDVEFMDTKRFLTDENIAAFHDLLKMKLELIGRYDAIISADDNALRFAIENREELFPETPVVSFGINDQDLARSLNQKDDFTGVIEDVSIRETLALIREMLPNVKTIYSVVDSTPSGQADFVQFSALQHDFPAFNFINLSLENMVWAELQHKLQNLSSDSAVFLIAAYRDKNGSAKSFQNGISFISSSSSVPVFHHYEYGLGNGVLGGKVLSQLEQGMIAGRMALDIINGKPVKDIAVVEGGDANKYIFDRNVLTRFGIKDSILPKDSIVINDTVSILDSYKFEIAVMGFTVFTLVILFVALLMAYIKLHRTQEMVRESRERFALAMAANKDGVWDWNIKTDDVYYSPGYKAMLGYKADEVPSHVDSWLDLIHIDDRELAFSQNNKCIKNQIDNFEVEFRMQAKDGSWRWILGRGNAVERDSQGHALRMIGTHTDITERKKSEEEIRHLRNYLKSIIDSTPFVLVGIDTEGCVTLWNKKAAVVTGVPAVEAVGVPVEQAYPGLSEYMDRVGDALSEHTVWSDTRVIKKNGNDIFYNDITVYPLSSEGQSGVVVLIDDVTERVRLEDMVVQNEKMLSIGGLAAGMAHEINNPLGVIVQGAQNIRRRALEELARNVKAAEERNVNLEDIHGYLCDRGIPKILDGISAAAMRAGRIVSNMLSFSRKSKDNFRYYDFSILLDETIELAANEYNLSTKYDFRKIDIVREYDSSAPAVLCEGSEIQQVFLNLLKNGAQSMNSKEYFDDIPRFILRVYERDNCAVVEIEDNGTGMDLEVRKRIFEPFYTTKRVGEGTGLGLAISYFIITDLHKGSMEVSSSVGQWTRFMVSLPLGRGDYTEAYSWSES